MALRGKDYFEMAAVARSSRQPIHGNFACPCCGVYDLSEAGGWEICDNCGWEDDPVQEANPNLGGGANQFSLVEAREHYRLNGRCEPPRRLPDLPG